MFSFVFVKISSSTLNYMKKEEGTHSNTAEQRWWGHMGLCMSLGPAAASCNVWLPSFFCFLAADDAWVSQCHRDGRKTSPVHVCAGQRSVSKHRKVAGCYLTEGQAVVVLLICFVSHLAGNVFLVGLLLPSQSYPFYLSQTNNKLFLLLKSLPACSVSSSDSCTWDSDAESILGQLCVCRMCAGTSFILMWIDTRSGNVFF